MKTITVFFDPIPLELLDPLRENISKLYNLVYSYELTLTSFYIGSEVDTLNKLAYTLVEILNECAIYSVKLVSRLSCTWITNINFVGSSGISIFELKAVIREAYQTLLVNHHEVLIKLDIDKLEFFESEKNTPNKVQFLELLGVQFPLSEYEIEYTKETLECNLYSKNLFIEKLPEIESKFRFITRKIILYDLRIFLITKHNTNEILIAVPTNANSAARKQVIAGYRLSLKSRMQDFIELLSLDLVIDKEQWSKRFSLCKLASGRTILDRMNDMYKFVMHLLLSESDRKIVEELVYYINIPFCSRLAIDKTSFEIFFYISFLIAEKQTQYSYYLEQCVYNEDNSVTLAIQLLHYIDEVFETVSEYKNSNIKFSNAKDPLKLRHKINNFFSILLHYNKFFNPLNCAKSYKNLGLADTEVEHYFLNFLQGKFNLNGKHISDLRTYVDIRSKWIYIVSELLVSDSQVFYDAIQLKVRINKLVNNLRFESLKKLQYTEEIRSVQDLQKILSKIIEETNMRLNSERLFIEADKFNIELAEFLFTINNFLNIFLK